MNSRLMAQYCNISLPAEAILKKAIIKYDMSARAYDRILKVARTIADLDSSETIEPRHIAEVVGYRILDPASWGSFYPNV